MSKRRTPFILFLQPAMVLMSRLRFPWKFGLISSLFILPLLVLGLGLVEELRNQTRHINNEVKGLEGIKGIYLLMQSAEQYRDLSVQIVNDQDKTLLARVDIFKKEVEIRLVNLKILLGELESEPLNERYFKLVKIWESTQKNSSATRGFKSQYQFYDAFVIACRSLIKDAANTSKLVLDPELESFLLINILIQQLPNTTQSMTLGRAMGALSLTSGYINSEMYEILDDVYLGLEHDFDAIISSLAYSAESNAELLTPIDGTIAKAVSSIQDMKQYLSDNTIESESLNLPWNDFFQASTAYIDNVYDLIFLAIPFTESLLEKRRDELLDHFILILMSTVALLLVIFYLLAGMHFSIAKTVEEFQADALKATNGDLTVTMRESSGDELSELSKAFNHMVRNIQEVVVLVKGTSEDVVNLSQTLGETAQISRHSIKTQQADIHELTDEIHQVAKSTEVVVKQTQRNVEEADVIHDKSLKSVASLEQALNDINNLVNGITDSSEKISRLDQTGKEIEDVLIGIKTIADQTNLLALNAAIEAARAGEQGRGFAVVADEVRNLASNTVNSTEEISEKIDNFSRCIREVVASMNSNQEAARRTQASSDEVTESLREIKVAAEDIGQSSGEIAKNSQVQNDMTVRANQHIKTIDDSVRQSTDVVGNVVRVTTELNSLTQQLSVLVKRFTVDSNSVDTEKTEEISNENTDDNVDFF
jgi:methyl-accepting chemotaxis protein